MRAYFPDLAVLQSLYGLASTNGLMKTKRVSLVGILLIEYARHLHLTENANARFYKPIPKLNDIERTNELTFKLMSFVFHRSCIHIYIFFYFFIFVASMISIDRYIDERVPINEAYPFASFNSPRLYFDTNWTLTF